MSRIIQIVFVVLIVVIGLAFHIRNDQPITLDFYLFAKDGIPLSWALVGAFSLGVALGFFVMFLSVLKVRSQNRRLARKHEIATEEITNLRAIPLKDAP